MTDAPAPNLADDILSSVNVEIRVCVGSAKPSVDELIKLQADAILPLDKTVSDQVELFVGDRRIGKGLLEEVEGSDDGQLAVRLTEIGSTTGPTA